MTREVIACWWFPFLAGGGIASFITLVCCGRLQRLQAWLDSPAPRHDYPSPPHHVRLMRDEKAERKALAWDRWMELHDGDDRP